MEKVVQWCKKKPSGRNIKVVKKEGKKRSCILIFFLVSCVRVIHHEMALLLANF
jgi:hypothetical protein